MPIEPIKQPKLSERHQLVHAFTADYANQTFTHRYANITGPYNGTY